MEWFLLVGLYPLYRIMGAPPRHSTRLESEALADTGYRPSISVGSISVQFRVTTPGIGFRRYYQLVSDTGH